MGKASEAIERIRWERARLVGFGLNPDEFACTCTGCTADAVAGALQAQAERMADLATRPCSTCGTLADALDALVSDDMDLGEHRDQVVAALRLVGRL